jgi:hypothetical protein
VNAHGLRLDHIDVRRLAGVEAIRLPAVIRGRFHMPTWPRVREILAAVADRTPSVVGPTAEGAYLVVRPVVDGQALEPTGDMRVVVVPAPDPRELLEPDPSAAITELMKMPLDAVCEFVDAIGQSLATRGVGASSTGHLLSGKWGDDGRMHRAFVSQLLRMFDGGALRTMVVNELGDPGARRMDGWVAVTAPAEQGISTRVAARTPELRPTKPSAAPPMMRGVPTTQLHVTAGNMPIVLVISLLWAWATKGACVVKPAADSVPLIAALGTALAEVDPTHPLARHTTLAYWRGGDRAIEDHLLADGAFDRRVMWGTDDALRSLAQRCGAADSIIMRPRYGISFVGRAAVEHDLEATVRLAAVDSVVADQQACMSSLLHVVEGTDSDADAYARALAEVLGAWDENDPHRAPHDVQGRLVNLRRGLLASADWHVRGPWPAGASAVARVNRYFDLRRHPGGRVVLVRAVDDLVSAAAVHANRDVSHVGVAPESALRGLRDVLVGHGVDNVLPLGEAERIYAGRPHDGMQVLNRLVRWVNG